MNGSNCTIFKFTNTTRVVRPIRRRVSMKSFQTIRNEITLGGFRPSSYMVTPHPEKR